MTTEPGTELAALPPTHVVAPFRHADQETFLREVVDPAADRIVEEHENPNTARNYAGDWRAWLEFTNAVGVDPDTIRESLLTTFVHWLDEVKERAPGTINRRLTGVTVTLRDRHGIHAVPKGITRQARGVLRGKRRRLGTTRDRGMAPAMTVEHLRAICQALPDDLPGLRTRALLTVGFGMGARRSEPASLLVTDIDDHHPGYLEVALQYSKTGDGRTVAINAGTHPATCAVTAWRAWKAAAGLVDGPAFRAVDRHENVGTGHLSGWAVNEIVIAATAAVGIGVHYTSHSLRAGLVTAAWLAGHDDKTICDQTGHLPGGRQVHIYKREADRQGRNASTGLGL